MTSATTPRAVCWGRATARAHRMKRGEERRDDEREKKVAPHLGFRSGFREHLQDNPFYVSSAKTMLGVEHPYGFSGMMFP